MRAMLVFLQPELTGMRVDIFGDNEGAKAIVDNPSSASRSKHIDGKLVSCTWRRRSNMHMSSRNPCGQRSFC